MDYNDLISGMKRFGSTKRDIVTSCLGVEPEQVNENVIIAPWWTPNTLPALGDAELISEKQTLTGVWNIKNGDVEMTYIRTGIGAPQFIEGLLPLGLTKCKTIIFIGSVGSLDSNIGIGNIVIPEYSVCGDGVSRYIASDDLKHDPFGEKAYPDPDLLKKTIETTKQICIEKNVEYHTVVTFSIDTIFAQFAHIDTIVNMGCNTIEMETASAFKAANMMNIPMVAILSVSDNTITKKSLISGRNQDEIEYRAFTRRELFPQIILSVFRNK